MIVKKKILTVPLSPDSPLIPLHVWEKFHSYCRYSHMNTWNIIFNQTSIQRSKTKSDRRFYEFGQYDRFRHHKPSDLIVIQIQPLNIHTKLNFQKFGREREWVCSSSSSSSPCFCKSQFPLLLLRFLSLKSLQPHSLSRTLSRAEIEVHLNCVTLFAELGACIASCEIACGVCVLGFRLWESVNLSCFYFCRNNKTRCVELSFLDFSFIFFEERGTWNLQWNFD